jgi:hypothetical protein
MTDGKSAQYSGSVAALMQRGVSLAESYLIKGAGRESPAGDARPLFR